jgi:ATP-dependent DNA helicase RecG
MSGSEPTGRGAATAADDARYHLEDRLVQLRGIGPRWADELAERGVATVRDLLDHQPFRYEDRRQPSRLADVRPGEPLTAIGIVRTAKVFRTRRGLTGLNVMLDDGTGALRVVFYGRAYLQDIIRVDSRLVVSGTPRFGRSGLELQGPAFEVLRDGEDPAGRIGWIPIYEKLGPLTGRRLRAVVEEALAGLAPPRELLPAALLAARRLPGLREAYADVHAPSAATPEHELEARRTAGHRRLAYEELLLLELGLAIRRRRRRAARKGAGYRIDDATRARMLALLPFTLTGAQQRVLGEIEEDLGAPWPMHRLLLGDVGSGKTAVAALAMLTALESGHQAALMAPTEILAHQHAASLQRLLLPAGVKVELLTAGVPAADQAAVRERIAGGRARLVVGTHSLISEKVRFARLGLCVIDEQHRFGVAQRAELADKGDHPDVLVMSATPIPRTLAMVIYGDLDVSLIDEKPPGRRPIRTVVRAAEQRERVFEGMRVALDEGRQVYVVRPAVEEGAMGARAAEEGLREYSARFPDVTVAMVHGRMRSAERQENLDAFAAGRVRVLVATTVIEVGIDVRDASVIVVEDADRFGLAQLHQLRGRVGRGDVRSYCVLIASEGAGEAALERLAVLARTDDGFRVAEKDLELRGPGEMAGTAQHGMPSFRAADIVRHKDLLLAAREDAFRLVDDERRGLPAPLYREVLHRHGERLRLADVG